MKSVRSILCILLVMVLTLASCKPGEKSSSDISETSDIDSSSSLTETSSDDSSSTSSDVSNPSSKSTSNSYGGNLGYTGPRLTYKPESFTNTKGTVENVKLPGKEYSPVYGKDVYANYKPSDGSIGPSGATDKDRVYILLYDHTDWHGGRINFYNPADGTGVRDRQLSAMQIGLRETYPGLKLGNQYGGGTYEYFDKRVKELGDAKSKEVWNKFLNIAKSPDYSIVGGTYSQAVSGYISEELAILQFQYGLDEIKKWTGKTVKYYAHSENTGFYYMPQILKDFGYDGAITRTHWQVAGYPPAFNKSFGWWVGPDGTPIKVITTAAGDNLRVDGGINRSEADLVDWARHVPGLLNSGSTIRQINNYYYDKKKLGIDYVVMTCIEDTGFDIHVPNIIKAIQKADPKGEKYKIVTAEELFKIVKVDSENPSFRMTPNQWQMQWNSGYFGNNLVKASQINTYYTDALEKLTVFAKIAGISGVKENRDLFDRSWKAIIEAEAHDGHLVPEFTHASWVALERSRSAMDLIKTQVEGNLINSIQTKHNGKNLVIFNTQSFDRKEIVNYKLEFYEDIKITGVKDADTGKNISFDIMDAETRFGVTTLTLSFVADVPGFGHATYNIITSKGKSENTLKPSSNLLNTVNSSGKVTLNGKDFSAVIYKDGSLESMKLKDGTEVIGKSSNIFTGRFHNLDTPQTGTKETSNAKVTSIEEGANIYRVTVSGSIKNQDFVWKMAVYKTLPYADFNLVFDFEPNVGIGNYVLPGGKFFGATAWTEANDNARRDRLCVNFNTGFKLASGNDPFNPSYSLYDASAYNSKVNVSRYTAFYPEQFKRENESNTLSTWPKLDTNHIYNIFSKYFIDISDTAGNKGFSLVTQGNGAYVYDGNMLSYVLARSSPAEDNPFDEINQLYTSFRGWTEAGLQGGFSMSSIGIEQSGKGNYSWQYRIIPHAAKASTTTFKLSDGSTFDSLREGIAFNNPLYIVYMEKGNDGKLPPKYRYMLTDTGSGTITSSLKLYNGNIYARVFEYQGKKWGTARFTMNAKPASIQPVSMNLRETRNHPSYLGPYKIYTYRVK